jgi:hypothetical protein
MVALSAVVLGFELGRVKPEYNLSIFCFLEQAAL